MTYFERLQRLERLRKHMIEDRTTTNTRRADPNEEHPLAELTRFELERRKKKG